MRDTLTKAYLWSAKVLLLEIETLEIKVVTQGARQSNATKWHKWIPLCDLSNLAVFPSTPWDKTLITVSSQQPMI